MSRLASSRFRRRAGWLGALVAVSGGVALIVVLVGNTGHTVPQRFEAGKPQVVPPPPKPDVFTAAERREVRAVATRFVESAVYRRHVDDSWGNHDPRPAPGASPAATGPAARSGRPLQRRCSAQRFAGSLDYSYAKDVASRSPSTRSPGSGAARQIFEIELENHGTDTTPNWLVSYWAPSGGPQLQTAQPGGPKAPVVGVGRGQLGAIWLFVPVGLIVGGLLGRGRLRRRARAGAPGASRSSLQLEDESLLSQLEPVGEG
jgi:hypothetical protein